MASDIKDNFGEVMRNARTAMDMTQDQLAECLGISNRYIVQLEKDRKKPSFNLLFRIIRKLNIKPDLIFYPEKPSKDSQVEDLVRMLYNCDERSMKVIRATVKAALESQSQVLVVIWEKLEPITVILLTNYRLCVLASGSFLDNRRILLSYCNYSFLFALRAK